MLPRIAMPRAAPNSRVASFIAEPAPARRSGTDIMIDAVIGDIASAIPVVSGITQSTTYAYAVFASSPRNNMNPSAMLHMPNATVRCAPKRALGLQSVASATRIALIFAVVVVSFGAMISFLIPRVGLTPEVEVDLLERVEPIDLIRTPEDVATTA
jgi:hypothetical protein